LGLSGNPESLIAFIRDSGVKNLTIVTNDSADDQTDLSALLSNGQVRKLISSSMNDSKLIRQLLASGQLELELTSPATLVERVIAGGAGIPVFHTRTGVGTPDAEGKPLEHIDGHLHVRETWLQADLAIVKAWRADHEGNLMFRKTMRTFNPIMATAARFTAVEVEEMVSVGTLHPNNVHTRGLYVDRVIQGLTTVRRLEKGVVGYRAA
jgi:3-oxoacid CoA-transferase subunit A